MAQLLAGLLVLAGVVLAALALSVARRRGAHAGRPLAVLLLAAAWWGFAGAVEVSVAEDPVLLLLWGDLKYAGIVLVSPAWLVFVLLFLGRRNWVTRRTLGLLAIEPLLVLLVLAVPDLHQEFRYLDPARQDEALPVVSTGRLFWVHAVYSYVLVLGATVAFVRGLLRTGRVYRPLSVALGLAAVVPWTANLLFNLEVGPFALIDLTPFLFVVSGAVLVRGLLHGRLLSLAVLARDVVLDTLTDGVLVADAFDRVVEANSAARAMLPGWRTPVGVPLADLLPHLRRNTATGLTRLGTTAGERVVEVRRQPLPDRSGAAAGEVLLLRDVTEQAAAEQQVRLLLQERTRVAAALQTALLPAELPRLPGVDAVALYRPAGQGREIGGDFYEVFPLADGRWCTVIGDVAGKGAEAAAVTARVRFTLRALSTGGSRAEDVLRAVNAALAAVGDDERFCTLAHLLLRPYDGGATVEIVLAGHLQPLLRCADGTVTAVGTPGTALGLVTDPVLVSTTVGLRDGEALCLFTDGLVESRDADGEELGTARVAEVLRRADPRNPQAVLAGLEAAAREWHGGPLGDDLAILLLTARPATGRP